MVTWLVLFFLLHGSYGLHVVDFYFFLATWFNFFFFWISWYLSILIFILFLSLFYFLHEERIVSYLEKGPPKLLTKESPRVQMECKYSHPKETDPKGITTWEKNEGRKRVLRRFANYFWKGTVPQAIYIYIYGKTQEAKTFLEISTFGTI